MDEIKAQITKMKLKGHEKVAGEHSLSIGEIVLTIIGILIIVFGTKAKIPKKWCLPLGILVIFMGEWVF